MNTITLFRKSFWHYLFSMMVVLSILISPTMSAHAAEIEPPDSPNNLIQQLSDAGPNANSVFAKMSPDQQKKVMNALRVAKVKTEISRVSGPHINTYTSCATLTATRSGYNILGGKLWSYKQQVYRCYNGSTVSSISTNRWGETYAPLWSWHLRGKNTRGGNGQSSYYFWGQADFELCVNGQGWGCIQYSYPWIEETVYKNGSYSVNGGG